MTSDVYELEVERLTKLIQDSPSDRGRIIYRAWSFSEGHSPLFDSCSRDRGAASACGCLTQIRYGMTTKAETPELTDAIRADERLPKDVMGVGVEHLPVFAEWQRRIDKELGRTPPPSRPER